MFKIEELTLYMYNNQSHSYKFEYGINYLKGQNNTGKTIFYSVLDYMLGGKIIFEEYDCFAGVEEISMVVSFDDKRYLLTRTKERNRNYFSVLSNENEDEKEKARTNTYPIDYDEYKTNLEMIFTPDFNTLEKLNFISKQEFTYRTFTMFNFLGETRQGFLYNFLDKCDDIEYAVKLNTILNFIFNKKQEEILKMEEELEVLCTKIQKKEEITNKYRFIESEVNKYLPILDISLNYNNRNIETIKKKINALKAMKSRAPLCSDKSIVELGVMLSNIDEQIKILENSKKDATQIEIENKNRKFLLENLNSIIEKNKILEYLVDPIKSILGELDKTNSFSKYLINDDTIERLKKQRIKIRAEIKKANTLFKFYSLEEKEKALTLVENYLEANVSDYSEELRTLKQEAKRLRELIRKLQNEDDVKKINNLSDYITSLYVNAGEGNPDLDLFTNEDIQKKGFKITYIKRGNILQTIKKEESIKNGQKVTKFANYYPGSLARHTLIQLCGYFGFLKILLGEYPLVPILVIDHLSKPFDKKNIKLIGPLIKNAINDLGKENLQIFLFDDEDYKSLDLQPDHYEDLIEVDKDGKIIKSGFIPCFNLKK